MKASAFIPDSHYDREGPREYYVTVSFMNRRFKTNPFQIDDDQANINEEFLFDLDNKLKIPDLIKL